MYVALALIDVEAMIVEGVTLIVDDVVARALSTLPVGDDEVVDDNRVLPVIVSLAPSFSVGVELSDTVAEAVILDGVGRTARVVFTDAPLETLIVDELGLTVYTPESGISTGQKLHCRLFLFQ